MVMNGNNDDDNDDDNGDDNDDDNANPLPILRGDKNMNNENSISGSEDGDKNDVSQQLRNRNNLTPTELSESEYKRINNLNLTRWAS